MAVLEDRQGERSAPWPAAAAAALQRHVQACVRNLQSTLQQLQQPHARQQLSRLRASPAAPPLASLGHAAGTQPLQPQQPTAAAPSPAAGSSWGGGGGVSKEEVGRASWIFLHTLAAQYPDHPSRQQKRDVRTLLDILTRMYPCAECAEHFKQLCHDSPPTVGSRGELQRWMCEAHNTVNRRLGKPTFNCALVESRWGGIDCGEDGGVGCALQPLGTTGRRS